LKPEQRNKIIFERLEKDKTFEAMLQTRVEIQKKMDICYNKWRLAKKLFNKKCILDLK